jgi:hypothetical protein
MLSFGRKNAYDLQKPEIITKFCNFRHHFSFAINSDTYKLDEVILGESLPHTLNHEFSRYTFRCVFNNDSVCDHLSDVFKPEKTAKALIVLSEDSELDDLNSCFSCGYEISDDEPFVLSESILSEHPIKSRHILIAERKKRSRASHVPNDYQFCSGILGRMHKNYFKLLQTNVDISASCDRAHFVFSHYRGNDTWHDHRHLNISWMGQSWYAEIAQI